MGKNKVFLVCLGGHFVLAEYKYKEKTLSSRKLDGSTRVRGQKISSVFTSKASFELDMYTYLLRMRIKVSKVQFVIEKEM